MNDRSERGGNTTTVIHKALTCSPTESDPDDPLLALDHCHRSDRGRSLETADPCCLSEIEEPRRSRLILPFSPWTIFKRIRQDGPCGHHTSLTFAGASFSSHAPLNATMKPTRIYGRTSLSSGARRGIRLQVERVDLPLPRRVYRKCGGIDASSNLNATGTLRNPSCQLKKVPKKKLKTSWNRLCGACLPRPLHQPQSRSNYGQGCQHRRER